MEAIPPIQVLIQGLANFTLFTTLDLKSAYFKVSLDRTGAQIGITTQFGNYEFNRPPFGLASAPAVFTKFLKYVLSHLKFDDMLHTVQCYLDDIIIGSNDEKFRLKLVEDIFIILQDFGLHLTIKKIKLANGEIEFVGYLIKDGKRFPTPEKVAMVRNWKLPTTAKEWHSFVGFVNFLYKR